MSFLLPRLGCCLLLLAAAPAATARRFPATWALGVRGGLAQAWLRPKEDGNSRIAPAFGVSVGRQFPALRIGLYADAFYEGRRFVLPGRWEASDLSYLAIPVYVRTEKLRNRLHVQLGATYAIRLTRARLSPLYQDWQVHQNE